MPLGERQQWEQDALEKDRDKPRYPNYYPYQLPSHALPHPPASASTDPPQIPVGYTPASPSPFSQTGFDSMDWEGHDRDRTLGCDERERGIELEHERELERELERERNRREAKRLKRRLRKQLARLKDVITRDVLLTKSLHSLGEYIYHDHHDKTDLTSDY